MNGGNGGGGDGDGESAVAVAMKEEKTTVIHAHRARHAFMKLCQIGRDPDPHHHTGDKSRKPSRCSFNLRSSRSFFVMPSGTGCCAHRPGLAATRATN